MPAEPNAQSCRPIASESRNAFPLQTVPYEQPGQEKHEWHSEGVGKPDNRVEAGPAPAVYYGICPPKARPRPKHDLQRRERAVGQDRVDCDHDDDDGRAKIPDGKAVMRVPGRFRPGYWYRTFHEWAPSHSAFWRKSCAPMISRDLVARSMSDVRNGSSRRAGGSSSVLRPTRARVDSWLFGYSIVPKWSTFWDTTLLFERHVSGSTPRPEAEQRMLPVLGFCRGVDKTCCVPNASFLGRWNSQRAKSCSRLL